MADIVTRWDVSGGVADWVPSPSETVIWTDETGNSVTDENGVPIDAIFTVGSGLLAGDDLMTAVLISIFTDAEAGDDDVIPDGSGDPRGWWASPIGSKLWLRMRSKATPNTAALVKQDLQEALAWLVSDNVAASVDVATEWVRRGVLGVRIVISRANGTRRAVAFSRLWENL